MTGGSRMRIPLGAGLLALLTLCVAAGAQDKKATVPVFSDGEAQIVEGFKDSSKWIRHDLWVQTNFNTDGDDKPDRMHVSVCRPQQTDTEGLKVPVIYISSPYFAGTGPNGREFFWDPKHELGANPPSHKHPPAIKHQSRRPVISKSHTKTWVPRGYAVVHSESPGTGLSQGCPTVGGDNESLAPKAVIDWLNGRAPGYTSIDGNEEVKATWCTGKVGMTGTSYNGTLALAAATTGVEGLEAIIPIAPNTSYYHYYRSNGLIRHPGGYMGEDIDVLYDFINSGEPMRREYCDSNVRDKEMAENFDRITGDYNDFWFGRDYINELGPLKAATLMSHAFNDWNVMPEHSVRIYEALKEKKGLPLQAFFHQGGHGGPPPMKLMNRWFTRYLFGVQNGVEKDPRSWIVREGKKRTEPTPYEDYPNPGAAPVRLYPVKGGNETGKLIFKDQAGQGSEKLIDNYELKGSVLASQEKGDSRLLYATAKLSRPVHISGTARIRIKVASSQPAVNLSVWLVSLPWTKGGRTNDNLISRGWADPQNHESIRESKPLDPGKFYELDFDFQPDDQVIPAGQRIGLMVFSSDKDFTLWPKPGTELTVDLDATSIELPVVGGSKAFRRATRPKRRRLSAPGEPIHHPLPRTNGLGGF